MFMSGRSNVLFPLSMHTTLTLYLLLNEVFFNCLPTILLSGLTVTFSNRKFFCSTSGMTNDACFCLLLRFSMKLCSSLS